MDKQYHIYRQANGCPCAPEEYRGQRRSLAEAHARANALSKLDASNIYFVKEVSA